MHLANPAALWLLALLPLLILARLRRPAIRRTVPHLPFWRDAARSSAPAPARRLRRDPLVLLQVAIFCALVLALAGPHVSVPGRRVAVIVDVSMSMGARHRDGTRLERAQSGAIDLLRALPWGTTIDVIAAGPVPQDLARAESSAAARDALARAALTTAPADLEAAVARARAIAPDRIYVFTDLPRPPAIADAPPVEWTTVAAPIENVSVSAFSARRTSSDRRELQLLVSVTNHGAVPARTGVSVTNGDAEVWRETVEVGARSSVTLSRAIGTLEGSLTARLDRDDDLAADNVRTLVIPPARRHRVLAPDAGRVMNAALSTHPDVELVPVDASGDRRSSANAIFVCDRCSQPDTAAAGVLVIPPRSAPAMAAAPLVMTGDGPFQELRLDGELVVPIALPPPPPDAIVIARAAGVPVVVARDEGSRRVVEIRFDPGSSPLSLSPAFPVLIDALLDWLSIEARNPASLTAGDTLQWVLAGPVQEPAIRDAAGREVAFTTSAGRLVTAPLEAGIYRVDLSSGPRDVAVNPPVTESQPSARLAPSPEPAAPARDIRDLRSDVSWIAALLALLLVLLEWHRRLQWQARSTVVCAVSIRQGARA